MRPAATSRSCVIIRIVNPCCSALRTGRESSATSPCRDSQSARRRAAAGEPMSALAMQLAGAPLPRGGRQEVLTVTEADALERGLRTLASAATRLVPVHLGDPSRSPPPSGATGDGRTGRRTRAHGFANRRAACRSSARRRRRCSDTALRRTVEAAEDIHQRRLPRSRTARRSRAIHAATPAGRLLAARRPANRRPNRRLTPSQLDDRCPGWLSHPRTIRCRSPPRRDRPARACRLSASPDEAARG